MQARLNKDKNTDKKKEMMKEKFLFNTERNLLSVCLFVYWISGLFSGIPLIALEEKQNDTIFQTLSASSYSQQEKTRIFDFYESLEERKIPSALLVPQLREAIAKQIPATHLLEVLEINAISLNNAIKIIREEAKEDFFRQNPELWLRASHMLTAGTDPDALSQIIGMSGENSDKFRAISLLFAALIKWEISSRDALEISSAMTDSLIAPNEYRGLLDIFRKARMRRVNPEIITKKAIKEAPRCRTIEQLERRLLY